MNGEQYQQATGWLRRQAYEIAMFRMHAIALAVTDASDEEYSRAYEHIVKVTDNAADVLAEIVEQSPGDRENVRAALHVFTESLLANFTRPAVR
jgi:hypothetical protein